MSSKPVHHPDRSRADAGYTACTWILYLLCLCAVHGARAQAPASYACLAEGNFSHYNSAEVKALQIQLTELYPQAANGAEGQGRLQPDGRLGPITLYWLQRFCSNFALNQTPDLQHDLPERLAQLLRFTALYRPPTQLLTSLEFVDWASQHPRACDLDVRATLASGTDAALLQLAGCYISPEPAAAQVPSPQPPSIYVLQADDAAEIVKALLHDEGDPGVDPESLTAAIEAVFEPLFGIQYPTDTLLHRAIQAELIKALAVCRLDGATSLSDQWCATLQPQFSQLRTIAEDRTCTRQGTGLLQEDCDRAWRAHIDDLAREDLPTYQPQTLTWQGDDCGCVPPQIHTTGYGIYPYWYNQEESEKSGSKPKNPANDSKKSDELYAFSVFSRVAYYGITVDGNGKLLHYGTKKQAKTPLKDNSAASRAFIETARRYGSKVDWLIEIDWDNLREIEPSKQKAQQFFHNLSDNLVGFLSEELTQPSAKFRSWLTLGAAPRPRNGDGVTLYIKNYPNDEAALETFNKFFNELKQRIKGNDEKQNRGRTYRQNTYVNLMVDQKTFIDDKGAFGRENILYQLEKPNASTHDSMPHIQETKSTLVLVLLESPHKDSLDKIDGYTITVERALIVPVFVDQFKNFSKTAERDDLRARNITYAQESFGGVGFWPITVKQEPYLGFNEYIADRFADIDSVSFWTRTLCQHRWLLLGVLNGWLLLTLVYLLSVFYLSPHHCRSLPRPLAWLPHPVTVVAMLAPPIGLWLYLLLADPLFGVLNVTGLLVLVIVVLALWAGIRAIKVLRRPTPNRGLLRQLNRLRLHND